MEERQADSQRLEFVRWLAECQRNNSIAVEKSFRIEREWLESSELRDHSAYWGFAAFDLLYEPRSLTVDPLGGRVAVGTKFGEICLAAWDQKESLWRSRRLSAERLRIPRDGAQASPSAVRGLLLLDQRTLIAGWGFGGISIVTFPPDEQEEPSVVSLEPLEAFDRDDWDAGSRRFSRLVSLYPPGPQGPPPTGDLVLGITRGGELRVLSREGSNQYRLRAAAPEEVFSSWDASWGQLVDGVWERDRLWLLTSKGFLLLYETTEPDGLARLQKPKPKRLTPPDGKAVFRNLESCECGLAVLAGESVSFLWFVEKPGALPELTDDPLCWFQVPGAMDCTVFFPYPPKDLPREEVPRTERDNDVWVVVSTAEPGLRWISWPKRGDWPRAAPANFILAGGGSVLYVGVGRCAPGRPPFLACGTRDHKLVVTSVLHRPLCDGELSLLIESMLLVGEPSENGDGVHWWYLQRRIQHDLGSSEVSLHLPELGLDPVELLRSADKNNLRSLASRLVRWRNELFQEIRSDEPDRLARLDSVLTLWVLRILRRANQLGREVDEEIGRLLCEALQKAAISSSDGNRLTSLAGFLRKWIVHGHTYADKLGPLWKVYDWNRRCGRNLDSLVYLVRLMRQRSDHLWEAAPPVRAWIPTVWSLVASGDGDFVIASLADGALCAISGDGRIIRWELADSLEEGELGLDRKHRLSLKHGGQRLERVDADKFEKKYQHGPYARSLWLTAVPPDATQGAADREFLLVFCLKGWRRGDRDAETVEEDGIGREPRVYVVRLRLRIPKKSEESSHTPILEIVSASSEPVCNELYCLHEIDRRNDEGGALREIRLVAGTSGSWEKPGSNGGGETWIASPFIELVVGLRQGKADITVDPVPIERFVESERSVFRQKALIPETAYNPCWAIECSTVARGSETELWLWAGFQDGHIRGYRRQTRARGDEPGTVQTEKWIEGGGWDGDPQKPCRRGLKLTGAVWRLLELAGPEGNRMLAYGTGDGVVGVVRIDDLRSKEPGEPIPHLIHCREVSPICVLLDYDDWEPEEGGARGTYQPFLMSITQRGLVCVFSLDYRLWGYSAAGTPEGERRGLRFDYPGARVERFLISQSVRSAAWVGSRRRRQGDPPPAQPPQFFLGSGEGRVHRFELTFPYYSGRRRNEVESLRKLMNEPQKGRSVCDVLPPLGGDIRLGRGESPKMIQPWLKVLRIGETMLRFSFWDEMRQAGDSLFNERPGTTESEFRKSFVTFKETVDILAVETYHRRPFSREPAKILWQEGGKVATSIAYTVVSGSTPADPLLQLRLACFLELNTLFADLCNRWIGVDQTLESKVLVHSFATFFDWTSIILLATEQEPVAEMEKVRNFLVFNLLQRRLSFADPMVPLETLRVINAAILRAIVNNRPAVMKQRMFVIAPKQLNEKGQRRTGYFDLMAMVGDLWERTSGSLSVADPLTTEIIRFFSLSLLLVPDSALLTGQVVSESRLTEGGEGLERAILGQARSLRNELAGKWPEALNVSKNYLEKGLDRFDAYFRGTADLGITDAKGPLELPPDHEDKSWPWLYLASQGEALRVQGVPLGQFSDESMLVEQYHVMRTAAFLSDLNRHFGNEELTITEWKTKNRTYQEYPEPLHWLLDGSEKEYKAEFFRHSQEYLRHLALVREEVRYRAKLTSTPPPGWVVEQDPKKEEGRRRIQDAIECCVEVLANLERQYLFHPQRDHYEHVIRKWRDQLVNRAGGAVTVLDVLDKFNRHVYRTSADSLMDNMVDLAMRTAPLWYPESLAIQESEDEWKQALDGPLRLLIKKRLETYPLVRQVFETGERLVDSTHLAGALLTIARHSVGTPGDIARTPLWTARVSITEIRESVERAARRVGVWSREHGGWIASPGEQSTTVPGTQAIWDLIAQEYASNIAKYSRCEPGSRKRVCVRARLQKLCNERFCILISANVPYAEAKQRELRGPEAAAAVASIEKRLGAFLEAHERGSQKGDGSGMGLYMIDQIAKLCAMETQLLLADPVDDLREERTPEEKLRSPLSLGIFWED